MSNSEHLYIGHDPYHPDDYFNGTIDDILVWNRALSSDEISELYESYDPPPPPCQNGDIKLADDGFNQCVCAEGEWVCTDVVCEVCEDVEQGLPSISVIVSVSAIGLAAIFRRK